MRKLVVVWTVAVSVAAATGVSYGVQFDGVRSAALDQPQVNVAVLGSNGQPLSYEVPNWESFFDPSQPENVSTINIPAFLDTGASGILFSTNTNVALNLSPASYSGQTVQFSDSGVAGSSNFYVSTPLNLALAPFDPTVDVENPASYSLPVNGVRLQLAHQSGAIAPAFTVPVDNGSSDALDQLINGLSSVTDTVDVVGMPAMKNRTMVIDPTPLNNFNFDTLAQAILDGNIDSLPQMNVNTYLYAHGTPYTGAAGNPGVPHTNLHVQLTKADFTGYTLTTPSGAPAPTMNYNPFVGNPFDHSAGSKGVALTYQDPSHPGQEKTIEAKMLLDTGAAASIISTAIAQAWGFTIQTQQQIDPDTGETVDVPVLFLNGVQVPDDETFSLPISGVGGTSSMVGFYLDDLLLRTQEGIDSGDDALNIRFSHAPVLIGDVSVTDPTTGLPFTLDGILGMNFFMPSVDFSSDMLSFDTSAGAFRWVTFDEQTAMLGLDLPGVAVPEPASLALLAAGGLALLRRRRI